MARPEARLLASSALGHAKPSREAFEAACVAIGTAPSETVMIGDDLVRDIAGARAAGLKAMWVRHDLSPDADNEAVSLREAGRCLFGTRGAVLDVLNGVDR